MKVGDQAIEQVRANVVTSDPNENLYEPIRKTSVNPNDPYDTPEERAECDDWIFNKFFFWTGVGGTFSTWRERHIFLRGFYSGFNTALQQKFDPCPAMWEDEAQYYEAGQEAGYIVKNGAIWIPTSGAAGAILTYVMTNLNTIIPIIIKLSGQ